jgi:23S rRNA (uracil1939-C5)-methyltransferase
LGRSRQVISNVKVVSFGHKGLSIGKTEAGEAVLVEGAVPGDVINFQPRRKKKGMKLGHVDSFVQYSPDRVEPVCAHFEECGGCSWQNLSYDAQCQNKEAIVTNAIRRIGNLPDVPIKPILSGDRPLLYRNKVEYTFSNRRWLTTDEISSEEDLEYRGLGFHKSGAFDKVIDIETCHLQEEPTNKIRNLVRQWAFDNDFSFYNYRNHQGQLRNIIIKSTRAGAVMTILVTATDESDIIVSFKAMMDVEVPEVTDIIWMVNSKMNDSLFDIDFKVIKGNGYLIETLDGIKYKIGPKSFFQTNPYQAENLFRAVKEAAKIDPEDIVYDLYCGVGSIGLFMANACQKVVGIEEIPEAIDDAIENAKMNGIDNASFHVGDVKALLDTEFIKNHGKADIVITDPPRVGMHEDVVNALCEAKVDRIVYVSCNPATQARDLKMLSEVYDVEFVQPVDMFPQTNHVESIASLKKRI